MDQPKKPSHSKKFLNTTIRGLLIIIPLLGVIYLLHFLYTTISTEVQKIVDTTILETNTQVWVVALTTLVILVLVSYGIGAVSSSDPIVGASRKLDQDLMDRSDTYRNLKLNLDNTLQFMLEDKPSIFVSMGSFERPGFLMEKIPAENRCVVFLPKNFSTFDGNVYIVKEEDVRLTACSSEDFIYSLEHLGSGMDIS